MDHIEAVAPSTALEDASLESPEKPCLYLYWDIAEVASAETMA
jgi:hypothetical protein